MLEDKIIELFNKYDILLVHQDGKVVPVKNSTKQECYDLLYEIQELIEWRKLLFNKHLNEVINSCVTSTSKISKLVADLERPKSEWIPVSEKLPEQCNQSYLVTVDYGEGVICSCQRFFFNEDIGWNDDCVIAWQPLPKPYKEGDNNG